MREPMVIEVTMQDVLNCPSKPPKRKLLDFVPHRIVGLLRRWFFLDATPRERWYVVRGMAIMLEASARTQAALRLDTPKEDYEWGKNGIN